MSDDHDPEMIWDRLHRHLAEVGVTPVRVPDYTMSRGYGRPAWRRAEVAVELCPERIAETTAWLNEFDLDEYLRAVEVQIDYEVAHREMTGEEADEWLRSFLSNEAPGSLAILEAVQGSRS